MGLNDSLANAMSRIARYDSLARKVVEIRPKSKIIKRVLEILNEGGYVGSCEEVADSRGGFLKLNLIGKVNDCGVIRPRFSVKFSDMEKSEKRYLPAKGFGLIILSTPHGILTHTEAQKKKTGGVLLVYCY